MAKETGKKKEEAGRKSTSEKPISLYPLTPEEALKNLLQIPPPSKRKKRKPTRSSA
jgi:hypothetical protein